MSLVLVRIDCRLIHGQIIEAWVPFTRADCLIVANDDAATDILQRSIMEMAVPPTVEVAIHKVSDAVRILGNGHYLKKRVILLFANCQDAYLSSESGLRFETLNLGNLVCAPNNKKQITCSVSLDEQDIQYLKQLQKKGVKVEAQAVPYESSTTLVNLIPSEFRK